MHARNADLKALKMKVVCVKMSMGWKMTELKTLKDMYPEPASYSCGCGSCDEGCFGRCDIIKIKAVAVKWAKLHKVIEMADRRTFAWIVHFFNITEKDLEEAGK